MKPARRLSLLWSRRLKSALLIEALWVGWTPGFHNSSKRSCLFGLECVEGAGERRVCRIPSFMPSPRSSSGCAADGRVPCLPSAWWRPAVPPVCTSTAPPSTPSPCIHMCFVRACVCLNVRGCSDTPTAPHLSAGCSLRASPHPSSSGSYATPFLASSSYRNTFIIHLIAYSCFSVQQIRLASLISLAVYWLAVTHHYSDIWISLRQEACICCPFR